MAESTNEQIRSFDKQVDIEALISAPLVAASKANVVMVTGQTRFLLDNCFEKKDDHFEPVMIKMAITRGIIEEERNENRQNENDPEFTKKIKTVNLSFSVPLLCLVTFNSIAINKINLDFDLEITSASSWDYTSVDDINSKKITKKGVKLCGKISYDADKSEKENSQYKSTMSSRLKVNIGAGPLPLPVGLLSIIELYNKSIQPLPQAI